MECRCKQKLLRSQVVLELYQRLQRRLQFQVSCMKNSSWSSILVVHRTLSHSVTLVFHSSLCCYPCMLQLLQSNTRYHMLQIRSILNFLSYSFMTFLLPQSLMDSDSLNQNSKIFISLTVLLLGRVSPSLSYTFSSSFVMVYAWSIFLVPLSSSS